MVTGASSEPGDSALGRLLREPSWGWRDATGGVARPQISQVVAEISRNIDPRSRRNWSCAAMFAGFLVVGPCLVAAFFLRGPTAGQAALALTYFWVYTVLTNTVWWHRFASHRAFKIRKGWLKRLFRISAPIYLPVEVYVIPHRVHHAGPDRPGDPYTPLLGWAGCMSTEWTTGLLDPEMSAADFETACRLIRHTGVPLHDLAGFRRWGTVQTAGSLAGDALLSVSVHVSLLLSLGGVGAVLAAYTGLWIGHYLNLDFNYSAHGRGRAQHVDGWDYHREDLSLNQLGPGCIGGEWHNNHHLFPGSMRSGLKPGQPDVPFAIVRGMEMLGLVEDVQDHRARFLAAISATADRTPASHP